MNYYNEIKNNLIDVEVYKKVKDYSKNRYELEKYCNIGKLLIDAGKCYGESIIKKYSAMLTKEIGKKYSVRYLFDIKKLYLFSKVHPLGAQLTMSHYRLLFSINDKSKINYYINQVIDKNLSKRELAAAIKSQEYERLDDNTKLKLATKEDITIGDNLKHPVIIKNTFDTNEISEKMLKQLILNDIVNFMKELGNGFCFIDSEYKIKLDNKYNYIDLLLFNIPYNCYVVVELKVTELKKEHIGQIEFYMNYIDRNFKSLYHDKTIGIIIVKHNNNFVIEYCSDKRIYNTTYVLV